MKTWCTNKKSPSIHKDILVITKDHDIDIGWAEFDDHNYMLSIYSLIREDSTLWEDYKDNVKYWQYVEIYFDKELKD